MSAHLTAAEAAFNQAAKRGLEMDSRARARRSRGAHGRGICRAAWLWNPSRRLGAQHGQAEHHRATGPGPGIYVAHPDARTPPRDNRVIRNVTTSKHADGIRVDPDAAATLLSRNLAVHSG